MLTGNVGSVCYLPDPPLSAGGNAGLAAAYAAKKLGFPVTVVVPSTTGPTTVRKLEELGAEVEVSGQVTRRQPLKLGSGGGHGPEGADPELRLLCDAGAVHGKPQPEMVPSCIACTPALRQGHPRDPPPQPRVGFWCPPAPR